MSIGTCPGWRPDPGRPARGLRNVAPDIQVEAEPKPALGRPLHQAAGQVGLEGPLTHRRDLAVAAEQESGDCETFQFLRRQRTVGVCGVQGRVVPQSATPSA
jgi:hypothetical protein